MLLSILNILILALMFTLVHSYEKEINFLKSVIRDELKKDINEIEKQSKVKQPKKKGTKKNASGKATH